MITTKGVQKLALARAGFFVACTLSLAAALASLVAECTPEVVLAGATVILVWIASAMLAVAGFFTRFFCPIVVALVTRA